MVRRFPLGMRVADVAEADTVPFPHTGLAKLIRPARLGRRARTTFSASVFKSIEVLPYLRRRFG